MLRWLRQVGYDGSMPITSCRQRLRIQLRGAESPILFIRLPAEGGLRERVSMTECESRGEGSLRQAVMFEASHGCARLSRRQRGISGERTSR